MPRYSIGGSLVPDAGGSAIGLSVTDAYGQALAGDGVTIFAFGELGYCWIRTRTLGGQIRTPRGEHFAAGSLPKVSSHHLVIVDPLNLTAMK